MILTDDLIDQLHSFRVEMMEGSIDPLRSVITGAAGMAIGGGYVRFAGDASPTTQAYGIGHRDASFDLHEVEEFYRGRATNWEFIVTPFAGPAVLRQAADFGYVADHFETVLAQIACPGHSETLPDVAIEEVQGDLLEYLRISESAWSDQQELPEKPSELSRQLAAHPSRKFLARVRGEAAATAGMVGINGKYLFAGAATRPQFRNMGLQRALTQHRLALAGPGTLVQVVALPGSQSHRNLQRVGFQPLYSKLVLYRNPPK